MGEVDNSNLHDTGFDSDEHYSEAEVVDAVEQDSPKPDTTAKELGALSLGPASYFNLPNGPSPRSNFPITKPKKWF